MVFDLKRALCSFPFLRRSKVAPAPCSCTVKQESIRRPTPPAVLLPTKCEPDVRAENTLDEVFIPNYASTGISDEDLTMNDDTTFIIPVACDVLPTILASPRSPMKIAMKIPEFNYTDYQGPTVDYTDEQIFPDSDISLPLRTITARSAAEDLQVTRTRSAVKYLQVTRSRSAAEDLQVTQTSRVCSGQDKNNTIGKKVRRNLTRGKTFLRKMRKPRSLPHSPDDKKNSILKRSLPSVQGSFV